MPWSKIDITEESATKKLATELANALAPGAVLHLSGDLGAGKTTLCRYIIEALGYRGRVKSPTYTLVEPYSLEVATLYHFDLYRLADPSELEYIGYRDYFDGGSICLVEWPEKAQGLLGEPDLEIQIKMIGVSRMFCAKAYTEMGDRLFAKIVAN